MTTKSKATIATHASLQPEQNFGIPNPPVYHASTILKSSLDDYRNHVGQYDYGRIGTPTSEATEKAVAQLYGCDDIVAVPSGLSAIVVGILSAVKSGDQALFPDSLYGSGRRFVEQELPRHGVEPVFYDPLSKIADIAALITEQTSLIYIETPGSLTFEMQDTKAIVALAHDNGALVAADNTWGTALYFDVFGHGIDIVIEAGTKYISGHSDVSIGFVGGNGATGRAIRNHCLNYGLCVGPDDHYLALRGLRTMALRLSQSEKNGLALARWIEDQPEVVGMLHPGLESHPQHHLWKRDFTGSCGLFSFVIDAGISDQAVDDMVNNLTMFGIGASWGGFESLISEANFKRSVSSRPNGRVLRIYAGVEDTDDLLNDIKQGFDRLRGAE